MQPGRRVLAVDIGTSSVRALLYDGRAQPVPGAEVHLPYAPRVAADGTAEVDADQLVGLAQLAVDRVLRRSRRRDVAALAGAGLSSLWHGLIAADSGARALTPLYLWSDTRAASAALELARRHDPEEIRARTGCPLHSSYWPAKMLWLRRLRPDLWRPGVHWVSIGDLLFWRLFGRLGTSLSMASGTGLFLLRERRWDEDLLRTLEVDPASLPELAESAQGLEPGPDRRWPQLSQLPWLHALGDGALANLGSGCLDPSRRALTVGTSGALRVMYEGEPPQLPQGLWTYRLDGRRLVSGGALSNGGNLYSWLMATLRVDAGGLERRLGRMSPAAHGLTVLPHLAGQRSLGSGRDRRSAFVHHLRGDLARRLGGGRSRLRRRGPATGSGAARRHAAGRQRSWTAGLAGLDADHGRRDRPAAGCGPGPGGLQQGRGGLCPGMAEAGSCGRPGPRPRARSAASRPRHSDLPPRPSQAGALV
jgi:gluconokinase